ncbi:MAG: hypothetical protein NT138_03915 [Planctomycetales bacterium]|jgi:hypothetical protein|nr:hypothetical protein [Planctomycetales bacterium]
MIAVIPVENKEVDKQLKCQCKDYKPCLALFLLFAGDSAESFPSPPCLAADFAVGGFASAEELQT